MLSYSCLVLSCSSEATRSRAKKLADEIGSWHLDVPIDSVISALLSLFQTLTGKRPCYKVNTHLFFYYLQQILEVNMRMNMVNLNFKIFKFICFIKFICLPGESLFILDLYF